MSSIVFYFHIENKILNNRVLFSINYKLFEKKLLTHSSNIPKIRNSWIKKLISSRHNVWINSRYGA